MNTDIVKPVLTATEPASENFPAQTMSSREIADICGARHNDVVATIERLFEKEVLRESRKTLRPFSPPGGGRPTQVYDLTKRDCLVVVSGYDDHVRAKIIDRWMELEGIQRPMSPAEILIAQGQALLAVERQQAAIAAKQEEQGRKIAETERRLNQIETATDYFTVIGYARWAKSMRLDLKTAADVGRHATKRANHLGVKVMKVPDPRFGAVSQYPKAVLDFVWDEVFAPVH